MSRRLRDRKHGGVSRSLDYVESCLAKRARGRSTRKAMALQELAKLLLVVAHQAQRRDRECGYFLGELIALFWKTRASLASVNETFRKCFSRMESAHFPTAKDSSLRKLVSKVIRAAQHERRVLKIAARIPNSSILIKSNNKLLSLPELDSSPNAVDAWTDGVVYPRLKRMGRRLSNDPMIGNLKKALDENGKFQISRLRPVIKATVARIAALPQRYYFDIG
jgi:hypothetical protein